MPSNKSALNKTTRDNGSIETSQNGDIASAPKSRSPLLPVIAPSWLIATAVIILFSVVEATKQCANFGVQYLNDNKYPVPQTALVTLIEMCKVTFTVIASRGRLPAFSRDNLRASLPFVAPSLIYALQNNIYFYAITLISPPIWMILISLKTVFSACIYKFYLGRSTTNMQIFGAVLIVLSVAVTKLPTIIYSTTGNLGESARTNYVPLRAVFVVIVGCLNSVAGALYTETLFKKGSNRFSFMEQQFWLYLYSSVVALIIHHTVYPDYGLDTAIMDVLLDVNLARRQLFFLALFCSSFVGLIVAWVLKYLDNVVKEYSGQVSNILTAIVCAYIFPDRFEITVFIVLSLFLLFWGIYIYEKFKSPTVIVSSDKKSN